MIALVVSVVVLVPFYTTQLTPPGHFVPCSGNPPLLCTAPGTFFGISLGEFNFGAFSLTHGYAALGFLVAFGILAWREGEARSWPFLLVVVLAAVVAASDYNEFLGPYLPWVSLGSLVSIPIGAWFGLLTGKVVLE